MAGGSHPFGATFERDYNILGGRPNLSALSDWPEAVNLIGAMISSDPKRRPPIQAVRAHPVWWSPQQALLFVIQVVHIALCSLVPLAQSHTLCSMTGHAFA